MQMARVLLSRLFLCPLPFLLWLRRPLGLLARVDGFLLVRCRLHRRTATCPGRNRAASAGGRRILPFGRRRRSIRCGDNSDFALFGSLRGRGGGDCACIVLTTNLPR